ncbi:hypothetical protein CRG98_034170 [Punica granatum]|uniref:Uncharacterized protein n=1 Tax=Punica granatum TaxID=22663 RepID=A0A2I0IPK9_PUNGR|nr:hypothetical protein CRG98_034170 [Punica granatum]
MVVDWDPSYGYREVINLLACNQPMLRRGRGRKRALLQRVDLEDVIVVIAGMMMRIRRRGLGVGVMMMKMMRKRNPRYIIIRQVELEGIRTSSRSSDGVKLYLLLLLLLLPPAAA